MRTRRIKVAGEAVYHCMSKSVNGERVFDEVAREVLRKQLWQVADFTGVEVLTYTILSNHFHVLVRVPASREVSDAELLRRFQVLYPKPTKYQTARMEVVRTQLHSGGAEAEAWRKRLLASMGDVSAFMKLLKQRFATWFNKTHERFGPVWSDRFKSVLIEPRDRVIQTVAAYIDLNSVRAGLAHDPKDYRFCGYAEALAGGREARQGLRAVTNSSDWAAAQASYRKILFGTAAGARAHGGCIPIEEFKRVVHERGHLPLAVVLRCRLRYFSDGAVLGSKAFVASQLAGSRSHQRDLPRTSPRPLPRITDWGELAILRALRGAPVGRR
jgi:putative transposase